MRGECYSINYETVDFDRKERKSISRDHLTCAPVPLIVSFTNHSENDCWSMSLAINPRSSFVQFLGKKARKSVSDIADSRLHSVVNRVQ